jgi:hypothetical protein
MVITSKLRRHKIMERAMRALMGNNLPPRFKFKDTYDSIKVPTTHHQHLPSKATLEAKFDELIAEEDVVAPTTQINADMVVSSNLEVGTSNLFVDTQTGNIGIGTTNPSLNLHVMGGIKTQNNGVLTPQIQFGSGANNTNGWLVRANVSDTYAGEFSIDRQDNSTTPNKFVIKNNGDVGIGTANPSGALHVNGENIYISSAAVSNCTWRIMPQTGNTTKLFRIYDQDNAGDRLVIDASGNVGIGTTNPGYKLDVDGDINVTGTGSTFRINGTALANSATIAASASAGNSTIVQRHSAGYIFANYFNTTPNDVASGVTKVCVETGNDGYIRHGTSAAISTFLGLANSATIEATTADTANKIAQRNAQGDIHARLFRSDYPSETHSINSAAFAYRVSTSDNYIRFCNDMGAVRSRLGAYGNGSNITRTAHSNGYMIGSYNSVGANSTKTNPIYTIGSNYQPSDTSLGNMYGIGYSHGNFTSILTGGWGMYVAADGDARIGFNGSSGHIKCTGYVDAGTEVYCQNWIRTRGNTGHYWESSSNGHGWHIYPKTRADMYFRTGSGSGGIAGTVGNTTVRGYVHWNTSNQIGFLNNSRAWALRMTSDKNCTIFGGLELGTDGKDWGSMTASYNGNIRKNFWIQSTYGGNTSSNYGWWIGTQNETLHSGDNDLHFICLRNGSATHNGYIQDGSYNAHMNFTGQHRTFVKDTPTQQLQDKEGLIVSADQDEYIRMSGGIAHGSDAITINESLPVVSLSTKSNDKKCFGVLSTTEDPEGRQEVHGNFVSNFTKEKGDTRIYVNSVGEGAVWVTNINGNLESGDYITTSNVVGYGMKQDDDILHNYTVAKITMNCDFNPKTIPKKNIKKKLANVDYWVEYATIEITVEEYEALPENERKRGDEDNEDEDKYYKIYKKEIQIADPGDDKHVHEVHEEFVNVLDEHGQLQWEDHPTETEKAYKIRYLTSDGQITDEANAVHIAAFVGCTYHCG